MTDDDGRPTILGLPAHPDQLKVGIVQSTPTGPPKAKPPAVTPMQAVTVLLVALGMVCATTLGIVWMFTH